MTNIIPAFTALIGNPCTIAYVNNEWNSFEKLSEDTLNNPGSEQCVPVPFENSNWMEAVDERIKDWRHNCRLITGEYWRGSFVRDNDSHHKPATQHPPLLVQFLSRSRFNSVLTLFFGVRVRGEGGVRFFTCQPFSPTLALYPGYTVSLSYYTACGDNRLSRANNLIFHLMGYFCPNKLQDFNDFALFIQWQ